MQLRQYTCILKEAYVAVYWGAGNGETATWGTEGSWQSPGSPKARCPPSRTCCSSWQGTASLSMRRCCWSSFECAWLQAADSRTAESHRKPEEKESVLNSKTRRNMHEILNGNGLSIISTTTVHARPTSQAPLLWRAAWSRSLPALPPTPTSFHHPSVLLPVSFSLYSFFWESFFLCVCVCGRTGASFD